MQEVVVVVDSWRTAQRVLTLSDCLRLAYFDFNDIAHELRIRFLCNIMSIPLFLAVEELELGLFLSANQISMDHKNLWCCHQRIRPRFANKFHWTLIRSCKTQHKTHSKCLKNITWVAFKESKNLSSRMATRPEFLQHCRNFVCPILVCNFCSVSFHSIYCSIKTSGLLKIHSESSP